MKRESLRASIGLCVPALLAGLCVMSPSAGFALLVLSALLALLPTIFGKKAIRWTGVVLLILSLAFATSLYPAFRKDREAYVGRGRVAPVPQHVPSDPGK